MPVSWLLAVLIGLATLAGGGLLLALGLRGRPADALPYCRKCRFCLEGLPTAPTTASPATCPECGATLGPARSVRIGRRRRRVGMVVAGALCLLLVLGPAGTLGVLWARGFNWNTVKPVWLLEMDADSASVATSSGIWRELTSRLSAGALTRAHAARLTRRALELQQDQNHPWAVQIGDYIEAARDNGLVSDREWTDYYKSGLVLFASVRPEVRRGAPIPIRFGGGGGRLGGRASLGLQAARQTLQTRDGRVVAEGVGSAYLGLGAGGSGWMQTDLHGDLAVGEHDLVLVIDASLVPGYRATPIAEFQREFPARLRVVPPDQPTARLLAPGPADAQAEAAVRVSDLRVNAVHDGAANLYLGVVAAGLPVDCAFEVFARLPAPQGAPAGSPPQQVRLGTITLPATPGQHATGMGIELPAFHDDTMTIVLRPSIEAAERTTDMTEICPRQIVIPDQPVTWPQGVPRP